MLSNSNIINSEKNSNILHDSNKIEKKTLEALEKKNISMKLFKYL